MITIVISDDAEQIADKFAVATVYVVRCRRLVWTVAAAHDYERFCACAHRVKCFSDVDVDDTGDDVNYCGARADVVA